MGGKGGLFRYADGVDKFLMLIGTLGSLGDGLMSPLNMLVLSGIIDEYGTANLSLSNEVVDKYALRLLYVALGVGLSAFLEGLCWTRTAERQTSRIRTEYLKSVLRQEVGFFDSQGASSSTFKVVSSISADAHSIQGVIAEKIPNCLAELSALVFGLVIAFLLSWRLALASLPCALCFIAPGVGFGKIMLNIGMEKKDAYDIAGGIVEQAISSIRTVYSYVGECQTLESFRQALQESMNLGIKQGLMKGLMIGSTGIMFAAWAFESWAGSVLVLERGESGGHVFIAAVCVVLGGLSCMSVLPNISFIVEASAAATRIFEMADRVPEIDSKNPRGKVLGYVHGEIEFKGVYFSYPSRMDTPVLQGFSLKVKAGKTVGLVGGSGSGKSTVISLLERFYDPVKGDILLDGHRINRLKLKWLRSQMGLVNQEPILFATSIKENILFGKDDASMELVINAAKSANAHDFIVKLPLGYETQVGQYGFSLSGGQKQRIAIARALIKNPRILLLDEATSALDAQSERIVQEAITQVSRGRTTIVIAHRLTTIRDSDMIAVVQSGRVVESGSHDKLMQIGDNGVYSKMVKMQSTMNEASSPQRFTDEKIKNNKKGMMHEYTPKSYHNVRSSWQSSPLSPFSPALNVSVVPSIHMLSYYDSDDEKTDYSYSQDISLWRLLKMNVPEWQRAILGCLGAASFGAVQPVNACFLGSVVALFFSDDGSKIKSDIKIYCMIFLSIGVISFFGNIIQHYNFAVMGERLTKRVRENVVENILTFEVSWFDQDQNTSAAICARLATEASVVRSLVGDRMSLLVQVFTSAFVAFTLGLIITWRVSIVVIAIQPLIIASFYSKSVLMKGMSEKAQKAQNEGSQLASEAVVNHRTITAFSSQKKIVALFEETLKGPRSESIKQSWFSGIGLFISQFLTTASIALTYWYGGRLMNKGLVSSQHLFQAFFILMSTGKNIADAGSMSSDIARGSNAVKSIFAILDRRSEIEPDEPKGIKVRKGLKGNIELKNVHFSYPSRPDVIIFQGLNLKIEAGKTMALVGQSGSGKSTVIGLIERFYDPIKGSVLIDHQDVKNYNLRDLRSHIALVSQEPVLFSGTVYENIVYGMENATESEVIKAATLANAHEFLSSLKDGYNTYCGERGVQLSGGQKQRIALARAILKNPSILLLDEATSALDTISENLVQEALEKMMIRRTCVVVAHRLSTIQNADCIAVIKNGKVVEKGSHSELVGIGQKGSYYSLIKSQHGHPSYQP
ncbi:ABC transporter B family member 15-like [Dorcoceras hygrometricum]|uniref:ABC transporter B family member 15-like n=1 Tax=Dorcoceras hygrometricum TaxID=472368 RepID=A0A2Z7BZD2_9LAMI|nr:ABC transporter B family member 15-like [Dorcoceras hygrometricum]